MVKTVLSVQVCLRQVCLRQYSVFKRVFGLFTSSHPRSFGLKEVSLVFSFLITECWTLSTGYARDFGTHGVIYPIEETDPIQVIQRQLKAMEKSGELERHNRELQKKTKASVERPKPVSEITRATEALVFYYDPTYVVKEDLKDHKGQIVYKKGTRINPLETVSLSQNLLFFDGDDGDQKAWVIEKLKEKSSKLILTKGAPLHLSEELKEPVYFDQGGTLTKKFHIHHVPALITQDGLRLRIEEIQLKENDQSKSQRDL